MTCCLSNSCCAGHYSWRNTREGSWFIRTLSEELDKAMSSSSESVDFLHVLTKVSHRVAYNFESNAGQSQIAGKKQVPSLYSTLTKEIHFPNTASV